MSRSWDCTLELKDQIKKIIQELTDEFKLANILKVTKFLKSTYYYQVKKMGKEKSNHRNGNERYLSFLISNKSNLNLVMESLHQDFSILKYKKNQK